jgi:hypothetical protein
MGVWRLRVSHGQQFQKPVHTVTAITARIAAAYFAGLPRNNKNVYKG